MSSIRARPDRTRPTRRGSRTKWSVNPASPRSSRPRLRRGHSSRPRPAHRREHRRRPAPVDPRRPRRHCAALAATKAHSQPRRWRPTTSGLSPSLRCRTRSRSGQRPRPPPGRPWVPVLRPRTGGRPPPSDRWCAHDGPRSPPTAAGRTPTAGPSDPSSRRLAAKADQRYNDAAGNCSRAEVPAMRPAPTPARTNEAKSTSF